MDELKKLILQFLKRANSKKFAVWSVGTIGLFTHFVTSEQWMIITSLYLSAEGVLDWRRFVPPSKKEINESDTTVQ